MAKLQHYQVATQHIRHRDAWSKPEPTNQMCAPLTVSDNRNPATAAWFTLLVHSRRSRDLRAPGDPVALLCRSGASCEGFYPFEVAPMTYLTLNSLYLPILLPNSSQQQLKAFDSELLLLEEALTSLEEPATNPLGPIVTFMIK